jgi:emericellamide synthase (highly reducing iterative type I polyketide synthase)
MHSQGVKVIPKTCDIASKEAVRDVVRDLQAVDGLGPIRGVINAAMALEVSDTTLSTKTPKRNAD